MSQSLILLGDVYLDRTYKVNYVFRKPFIFNLEHPVSTRGEPLPNKICIRGYENYIKNAFGQNPIAVCLSNNHIMDYGKEAFDDTLSMLDSENIKYFGAGYEHNNYSNPLLLSIGRQSVAFMGYCDEKTYPKDILARAPKPAPLQPQKIASDIKDVRNKVDIIIISLHWGIIDCHFPEAKAVKFARSLIDSGADVIVGHHAHVIQPVERYHGRIIAYGLGNFIFPDLNLPTYYNHQGLSTRFLNKKQMPWHKSSIGLEISLNNFKYSLLTFHFNGREVTLSKEKYHKYASSRYLANNYEKYESIFNRHTSIITLIRQLVSSQFISRPRIPKPETILSILRKIKHIIQ